MARSKNSTDTIDALRKKLRDLSREHFKMGVANLHLRETLAAVSSERDALKITSGGANRDARA